MTNKTLYWHGGPAGRQRNNYLLPPIVTGSKSVSDLVPNNVHRRDRVYVTTSYKAALLYASGFRKGVVYLVEPVGDLEQDPDCFDPTLSFQCDRARVLKVIKPKPWEIKMARQALLT